MTELSTATPLDVYADDVQLPVRKAAGGFFKATLGGIRAFLGLPDFSTGSPGQALVLNGDEDGYDFVDLAGTSSVVQDMANAAHNLLAADASKYLRFTYAAGAKTLTVQPNSTEALPANGEWHIRNSAANNLTIATGVGVTINPPTGGTLVLQPQMTVTLKRVAADTFDLIGQTVPV